MTIDAHAQTMWSPSPPPGAATVPVAAAVQCTATREHLRRVFFLRNAVLLVAVAYAVTRFAAEGVAPSQWAMGLFLLAVTVNAATWARLREALPVSHGEFLLQIVADVVLLAAALHHSGGETSPLLVLYLVPLTIAAAALPVSHTAVVFVAVVLAHEIVCVYLPAGEWRAILEAERRQDAVDLLAAGLIAYFVAAMSRTSRDHQALLQRIHEDYLRQRHSADLGTLAAYAAHQLASPLATIAVLVGDLRSGAWKPKDLRTALDLMANEVQTCKTISSRLLASAGYSRAESGGRVAADRFLAAIVDKCQLMHPWIEVSCRHEGDSPPPEILAEASLEQAIMALLKRSPGPARRVEVSQRWNGQQLDIQICHCGSPAEESSKDELDIVMASHAVGRFGGAIERVHHDRGPCVRLSFPLGNLSVAGDKA